MLRPHSGQLGLGVVLRIGELDVSLLRVSRQYRQIREEVARVVHHAEAVTDVVGTHCLWPNVVFAEDLVVWLHGGKQV